MNEKRKSEGKRVETVFVDERSQAQKILDKCKANEHGRKLVAVWFGHNTVYLVPEGTDIEQWKEKKSKNLTKSREMV